MGAPAAPVEAKQDGSIRIQDLTKVVMARRRLGLAEERLVPFEAAGNVAYADDRPCAFHRISVVGLTLCSVLSPGFLPRSFPSSCVPSGLPALLPSGSGSVEDRRQERACGLVVETDAHERHRLDHA